MIYKVSYVVVGGEHPGAIVNSPNRPEVGDVVSFGDEDFEVLEVMELMPGRGDFQYLHATCKKVEKVK